jgi:hypothetical protein
MVILYFLGIFAYVGTEQGVANWISEFLQTYHGVNPQTDGASHCISFLGPDDRRDGTRVDPAKICRQPEGAYRVYAGGDGLPGRGFIFFQIHCFDCLSDWSAFLPL